MRHYIFDPQRRATRALNRTPSQPIPADTETLMVMRSGWHFAADIAARLQVSRQQIVASLVRLRAANWVEQDARRWRIKD